MCVLEIVWYLYVCVSLCFTENPPQLFEMVLSTNLDRPGRALDTYEPYILIPRCIQISCFSDT